MQPEQSGDEIARAAQRFAQWASRAAGQPIAPRIEDIAAAEERFAHAARQPGASGTPEAMLSDFAAYLGECGRAAHGGAWREDPLLGLVLVEVAGLPVVRLVPLAMAQKKAELGTELSLARFFETLPERLKRERPHAAPPEPPEDLAAQLAGGKWGTEQAAADAMARQFLAFWKTRHGLPLPMTLQGVREAERFLRAQFFLCTLPERTIAAMGFFVGEVGRGLFDGRWDFAELRAGGDVSRAALAWPELAYYPVGKVFKLLIEQPEGESLDEYLRLIPSARKTMREEIRPQRNTDEHG